MQNIIHLVGIAGSLRKDSYNKALLQTVMDEFLPHETGMEIVPIDDLPLYNGDMDLPIAAKRPESVEAFRNSLAKADGYVIASPEYNYGIPGVLKNAIDWAFRGEDAPMKNKPIAIIGATTSQWGTIRMQTAFQTLFLYMDMKPVYKPEVLIAEAKKKFENGRLTDETARKLVKEKLQKLKELILAGKEMPVS